jgi:hypothetical protein
MVSMALIALTATLAGLSVAAATTSGLPSPATTVSQAAMPPTLPDSRMGTMGLARGASGTASYVEPPCDGFATIPCPHSDRPGTV